MFIIIKMIIIILLYIMYMYNKYGKKITKKYPTNYRRFSPHLSEAIDTIETRGEKLCDLVIEAKQLLQAYDSKMDTLVQHFYYTAVHNR